MPPFRIFSPTNPILSGYSAGYPHNLSASLRRASDLDAARYAARPLPIRYGPRQAKEEKGLKVGRKCDLKPPEALWGQGGWLCSLKIFSLFAFFPFPLFPVSPLYQNLLPIPPE
jgi:hypothetical protein